MISQEVKLHCDGMTKPGFLASGSVSVAIATLAKGTLGAGILGLPMKTYFSGIPLFLVILTFLAYLACKSIEYICRGANRTKKYVFEEITESLYGRGWGIFLGVAMLLNCYGASIIYVIAIKDSFQTMLSEVSDSSGIDWPMYATLIVGGAVLIPFSIFEKINSLRAITIVGVSGVLLTVAAIMYAFFGKLGVSKTFNEDGNGGAASVSMKPMGGFVDMMTVISTLTFAFCNQFNVPQVFHETKDKSSLAIMKIAVVSTVLPMGLYIFAAICGYLCYGLDIESDILINFSPLIANNDVLIYIGVCALTFSVAVCHILNNFPMRLSVLYFLPQRFENNQWIKWGVPLFTATSTLLFGVWYSNLGFFLGFVGALTGSVICYIVPAMFSLKIAHIDRYAQVHNRTNGGVSSPHTIIGDDMDDINNASSDLSVMASNSKKAEGISIPQSLRLPWYIELYKNPLEYTMIVVGVVLGIVGTFCEIYSAVNK